MFCWLLSYGFSSQWHRRKWRTREAEIFINHLDHIGIFLMIAGSMMPVAILALPQASGWCLAAGVWTVALLGSLSTLGVIGGGRLGESMQTSLYVTMGGSGLLILPEMCAQLQKIELVLLGSSCLQ
mmetsp:Transcript_59216/g.80903  ORF Transcript_59216/g.80903 Transcript_59216/m.80903 type:complete len:126 (-) Transcript_59216:20-397(-)